MLTNGIILAISRRNTLKPSRHLVWAFAKSVHDTKYHERCSRTVEDHLFPRSDLMVQLPTV